jgi:hypothetical protein
LLNRVAVAALLQLLPQAGGLGSVRLADFEASLSRSGLSAATTRQPDWGIRNDEQFQ